MQPPASNDHRFSLPGITLYAWQQHALASWVRAGRQGIVEAVTGTGKTMVGVAAAAETVAQGGRVLVLVPTVELMSQWLGKLRGGGIGNVGGLGNGQDDSLYTRDVLVSVVNSARNLRTTRLPGNSLLVADECHRYGSAANAKALDTRFTRRLGLSATYARSDDGNAKYLDPYLGSLCFRLRYRQALDENIVAHFKVALVGVRLRPAERTAYAEAERRASEARRWLVRNGLVREAPFGEFMKDVAVLQARRSFGWQMAARYTKNFTEKGRVLADSEEKRLYLRQLIPSLQDANGVIVFTQTIDAAQHSATVLNAGGFAAGTLHSELERAERHEVLHRFKRRDLRAIVAPRVLDEGIDVPEADVAVIVSASQTQRQMIQRMGRILRKKRDGRLARFVILFSESTSEDPETGAHEAFLEEVTAVAEEVRHFKSGSSSQGIADFVRDHRGRPLAKVHPDGPTKPSVDDVSRSNRALHDWAVRRRRVEWPAPPHTPRGPQKPVLTPKPAWMQSQWERYLQCQKGTQGAGGATFSPRTDTKEISSPANVKKPAVAAPSLSKAQAKKARDQAEAKAKGITVEALICQRREAAAMDAALHDEARRQGIKVKELRKRLTRTTQS